MRMRESRSREETAPGKGQSHVVSPVYLGMAACHPNPTGAGAKTLARGLLQEGVI